MAQDFQKENPPPGRSSDRAERARPAELGHLPSTAAFAQPSTLNPQPLEVPEHELLCCIGKGSYGEVWLAKNRTGSFRAVKTVYRKTFGRERPYEREYAGLKKFEPISRSHEGLVDILQIGRNDAEGYFYYVMELADAASAASNQ